MFNKIIIKSDNLIYNVKQIKSENLNSKFCTMVKANAYGVGVEEVVKILNDYVDFYGVASFSEARFIKNLTDKKILIVGVLDKSEEIDNSFSYSCHCLEDLKFLISKNKKITIHIKINTGMNRFGFSSVTEFKKALTLIKKSELVLEGIFTHFATCDDYTDIQFNRFRKFVEIAKKNFKDCIVHCDNSIVNKIKNHNLDMIRIGFDIYNRNNLNKNVLEIQSEVIAIQNVKKGDLVGYDNRFIAERKTKVAVIPVGYADGFDLKNINLNLKVGEYSCKVINICMDCFMLDITKTKIKKGDVIYIIDNYNSLKVYSNHQQVSEYQIMTNFSKMRAERLISTSYDKYI